MTCWSCGHEQSAGWTCCQACGVLTTASVEAVCRGVASCAFAPELLDHHMSMKRERVWSAFVGDTEHCHPTRHGAALAAFEAAWREGMTVKVRPREAMSYGHPDLSPRLWSQWMGHFAADRDREPPGRKPSFHAPTVFERACADVARNGDDAKESERLWTTAAGGGVSASGIPGPLTGRPVDGIAIIDDPLRGREQAKLADLLCQAEDGSEGPDAFAMNGELGDCATAARILDAEMRRRATEARPIVASTAAGDIRAGDLVAWTNWPGKRQVRSVAPTCPACGKTGLHSCVPRAITPVDPDYHGTPEAARFTIDPERAAGDEDARERQERLRRIAQRFQERPR